MFERETDPTGKKQALIFDMMTAIIDTSATNTEWAMADESCYDQETAGGDGVGYRKTWPCKVVYHLLNTQEARHNTCSVFIR